jgi:hypothetical protein
LFTSPQPSVCVSLSLSVCASGTAHLDGQQDLPKQEFGLVFPQPLLALHKPKEIARRGPVHTQTHQHACACLLVYASASLDRAHGSPRGARLSVSLCWAHVQFQKDVYILLCVLHIVNVDNARLCGHVDSGPPPHVRKPSCPCEQRMHASQTSLCATLGVGTSLCAVVIHASAYTCV